MKKLLLDTNAIIAPVTLKIDVYKKASIALEEECEFYVLKGSLLEAEKIKKKALPLIKKMLEANKVKIIEISSKNVDEDILKVAKERDMNIVSNDRELLKKAKKQRIPCLFIRQKKYLEEY